MIPISNRDCLTVVKLLRILSDKLKPSHADRDVNNASAARLLANRLEQKLTDKATHDT